MKTVCILFALLVTATLALPAAAQYAIGDGTGLDNNLQIGGGSANPAQADNYINAGNSITTGNVQGLNYLSGRSPYRAPGEFSGSLPSNTLFRFNAQSLPNSAGQPYSLGSEPVYRSGAGVTAADVLTNNYMLSPRDAGANRMDGLGAGSISAGHSDYTRQMGSQLVPDGRRLELNASPLMGVRPGDTFISPAASPDASRDNPTINGVPVDVGRDGRLLIAPAPAADPNHPDARAAVEGQPIDRQLSFQLDDRRLGDDAESVGRQMAGLQTRLDLANAADAFNAGRGNDVYMKLLQKVEENRQKTVSDSLENKLAGEQLYGNEKDATPGTERKPGALETYRKQLLDRALNPRNPADSNNGNEKDDKMKDRLDQGWNLQNVPGAPILPGDKLPDNPNAPGNNPDFDQLPDGLTDLLKYDMPALSTLAADTKDQVNNLLRRAEEELLNQRYYDAEDTYRTILELQPGHPMARVGQLHAQLGVGMVYTAGQNMRRLFLQHPELIAARYDPRLLPATVRLQWVRDELTAMLDRDSKAAEPALLLAYLAYQFGEKEVLKNALDEALRRQPDKAIVQLLRRVWLNSQSASIGQPATRMIATQ